MPTALTLGGVNFRSSEVPEEIDKFGGFQKVVVHDFPGGQRIAQTFGYFPHEMITWSGMFFADESFFAGLQDRIQQILDQVVLGQSVELSFAFFQYSVLPYKLDLKPRLDTFIPYMIYLIPLEDLNNRAGPPVAPGAPSTQEISKVTNNLGTAPGSPLASKSNLPPVAPNPVANGSNSNIIPAAPLSIPTPVPANIASNLTSFQASLLQGIQNSLGQVSKINTPALQSQLNGLQAQLKPLIKGSDSGQAAFAAQTNAGLTELNNLLANRPGIIDTINVVNPNFMDLAVQYYGDATQWQVIAKANGLFVPNPVGIFELTIPELIS